MTNWGFLDVLIAVALACLSGVGKPSDSAIEDMLQNATGLSRTKSEWDRAFTVG